MEAINMSYIWKIHFSRLLQKDIYKYFNYVEFMRLHK